MKYLKIIFFCCIMFLFHGVVDAEIIGIDKVVNELPNTYTIRAFNELGSSISANVDKENYKLNLLGEGEVISSFDYTDEYIEFDNRETEVTEDNHNNDFFDAIFVDGIVKSLFNLNGFIDKTIDEEINISDISYEEYGIQMEVEHYEYSGTDEDGGNWSESGDYLKYFKISLDSEKISKLANDYGVDIITEEESIFKDATPTMRIGDEITSNSVYLYANIEGYEEEKEIDTPLCSFYRSTSLEGEYELVTEWQTPCLGEVGILDENLKSGTTYYYKAKVVDGNNYSEVVSVTTLNDNNETENEEVKNENEGKENIEINPDVSNSDKNNEEISNPKTGGNLIFLVIGCLSLSIFSFIMMYKNLKFI